MMRNNGELKIIKTKLIEAVASKITKMDQNFGPSLIKQIATETVRMIPDNYKKLNDRVIYFSNGDYDIKTGEFTLIENPPYNHRRLKRPFVIYKDMEDEMNQSDKLGNLMCSYAIDETHGKEMEEQLMYMFACMLVPTKLHRKMFQLYGSGFNGKSTVVEIFLEAIGYDKVSVLNMHQITSNRAFDKLELANKTVN